MNLKVARNIHLYLGSFFAPLMLFFVITGCLQTFGIHRSRKDGSYESPQIIKSLSEVHQHQRFPWSGKQPEVSDNFKYFVLAMSIGFIITTILGILMAFKFTKSWIVWLALLGGIAFPVIFIWMSYHSLS